MITVRIDKIIMISITLDTYVHVHVHVIACTVYVNKTLPYSTVITQ